MTDYYLVADRVVGVVSRYKHTARYRGHEDSKAQSRKNKRVNIQQIACAAEHIIAYAVDNDFEQGY